MFYLTICVSSFVYGNCLILSFLKHVCVTLYVVSIVTASPISVANEIPHLNVGRVPIDNQSTRSQSIAGKTAFEQVLVKLSGNKSILDNDLISRSARNYQQYLVSSSFISLNGKLVYQASFAQDRMLELLQFANVPVWGNLRPKTTVWIAQQSEANQQINIVTQLSEHPFVEKVNDIAFSRGIDLLIPVGDLEDSVNVSKYDIWGSFAVSIANYSAKFGNEYTLIARISLGFDEISSAEAYIAEWTVVGDKHIYSSKSAGATEDLALGALLSDYTDHLASRHAISSELLANTQQIQIEVIGIDTLGKYAQAISALEGIAVVSKVSVKKQTKESMVFELSVNADTQTLASVLKLDDRFREFQADDLSVSDSTRYEWVGR